VQSARVWLSQDASSVAPVAASPLTSVMGEALPVAVVPRLSSAEWLSAQNVDMNFPCLGNMEKPTENT